MNLNRIGDITSELSSNLLRSIVLPGGLLSWLTRNGGDKRFAREGKSPEESQSGRIAPLAGPVVIFGGAPAPDEAVVAFLHMTGGRGARVAVLPVAARDSAASGAETSRMLTRFGMKNIQIMDLDSRTTADRPEVAEQLAGFDALLLCGEDKLLGLERLLGTAALLAIRSSVAAGKPLAALDAAAEILGDGALTVHQDDGELLPGLGLLPGLAIDTAFTQRSRFRAMAQALRVNGGSDLLGAGVDAGAALVLRGSEARILGEQSVTFLDAIEAEAASPGIGVKVHVLTENCGMNLRTRRPYQVPGEAPQAAGQR